MSIGSQKQQWEITNREFGFKLTNGYYFTNNGNAYIGFTTSGTITTYNINTQADIYAVGGGGGGYFFLQGDRTNYAVGGGGAGAQSVSNVALSPQTYTITIGAGGDGNGNGIGTSTTVNAVSSFSNVVSVGGPVGTFGASNTPTSATNNMWNENGSSFGGFYWNTGTGHTNQNYYAAGGGWEKRSGGAYTLTAGNSGMPVNYGGGFGGTVPGYGDLGPGYVNSGSGGVGISVPPATPGDPYTCQGGSGIVIIKIRSS